FVIRRHVAQDGLREMDRALNVLFFIEHWINNRDAWPPCRHARDLSSGVRSKADDRLFRRRSHLPHDIAEGRREELDIASWDEPTRTGPPLTCQCLVQWDALPSLLVNSD